MAMTNLSIRLNLEKTAGNMGLPKVEQNCRTQHLKFYRTLS